MRRRSSRSASEVYRDHKGIIAALREIADKAIARHPELQRVMLFGSMARGDYGLYSDADVLLVLSTSKLDRFFDRIPEFLDDFVEAPVPVELLPYTEDELRRMEADGNMFIRRMLREGQLLAERPAAPEPQPADGEGDASTPEADAARTAVDAGLAAPSGEQIRHVAQALLERILRLPAMWGDARRVRLLLEAGGDPNHADDQGLTPLHWAVRNHHREVLDLLLDAGADINATDDLGRTPLRWAALKGREETAALLKRHGATESVADGREAGAARQDGGSEAARQERGTRPSKESS